MLSTAVGFERPGALELHHLTKTFPGGKGLRDVDLAVAPGTVHALLGQNGSGKSTLIKILAGVYRPDPGAVALRNGQEFGLGVNGAREAGIRFIHQDLGLLHDLTVADNLALGGDYTSRAWVSDAKENRAARALLDRFGIDLDPEDRVGALSQAQQSMVAIARALRDSDRGERIVVLDEPTAALPMREVEHLFGLIRRLRDEGDTVVYVTHRLGEVFEIADTVSVLRDGRRVATQPVADLDHDRLVELIVGRAIAPHQSTRHATEETAVLEVEGVSGEIVRDVSFATRPREVVGITGLVGSGYEEILSLLGGGAPRRGTVRVDGEVVPAADPQAAIAAGLAYAPADRKRLSAIMSWSLTENITLPALRAGFARWLSERRERRDAESWLERLGVAASPAQLFSTLSGGNQQRVVIARWLRAGARAFLLLEPTNGVDTGAKQAIYAALSDVAGSGSSVVIASSDVEELCAICDRVLVFAEGRILSVLQAEQLSPEALAAACLRTPTLRSLEHSHDH